MNHQFQKNAARRKNTALGITFLFFFGLFAMMYFSSNHPTSKQEKEQISTVEVKEA